MKPYTDELVKAALAYYWNCDKERELAHEALIVAVGEYVEANENILSIESMVEDVTTINSRAGGVLYRLFHHTYPGWAMQDFVDADPKTIRRINDAGPYTYKIWRDLLRRHGYEPTWAHLADRPK